MTSKEYSYSGSRVLQPLSNVIGLPVDQINLISAEVIALLFAFVFRSVFHHTRVTKRTRNLVSFVAGVLLCLFCIGHQIWHLFLQVTVAYILMRITPPNMIQMTILTWSMGYLFTKHLYRMMDNYGVYVLDVTGPVMVSTQKLCCLAFSYHDGRYKRDKDLTPDQRQQSVRQLPGVVEFLSYCFCFQGVLCGPLMFYNDYENFISGANFNTKSHNKGQVDNHIEPSANKVITNKLAFCCLSVFMTLVITPYFPIFRSADADFIANNCLLVRIVYLLMSLFCIRFKYYFAWMLSETVCHASGLGFNGYDDNGEAKWDLVDNVNVVTIETSTSIKVFIERWNMQTNVWLRRVCYNRLTFQRVLITNLLSAAWHGFYPGYYFTFIEMSFFVIAGRKIRRCIRPYFLVSPHAKLFYDIVTWVGTHVTMSYIMLPFVLLEFGSIIRFYNGMYWSLHIIVLFIHLLPIGLTATDPHRSVNSSTNHKRD